MINNLHSFSFTRLCRLMHHEILVNINSLRLWLELLLLYLYFTFSCYFYSPSLDHHPTLFYLLGLFITLRIYDDFRHTHKASAWLSLPCSNAERFLSKYVLIMLAYPLALFALFCLAFFSALLIQLALDGSMPQMESLSELAGSQFPSMMTYYFLMQAILILGCITFRSIPVIKTMISVLIIAAFFLLIPLTGYMIFTSLSKHGYCLPTKINFYAFTLLNQYGNEAHHLTCLLLILFCGYVSWLKLKEYEVN